MEWVVDTGKPVMVAKSTHRPAERRAASIPSISKFWSAMASGLMIPREMVAATLAPRNTEPRKARMLATITACLAVMALEPTDEAMPLAASLAPMLKAMSRPPQTAKTRIVVAISMRGMSRNDRER